MSAARTQTRAIALSAARCATAAAGAIALVAGAVALSGSTVRARGLLGLRFDAVSRSPLAAADIALHNAAIAGAVLACAAVAPHVTAHARRGLGTLLAALLVLNAGLVGLAIGAYGGPAVRATAAHVPLELAAMSLAAGAYMQACRRRLAARALANVAAATVLLLAAAALLETYASPGALR